MSDTIFLLRVLLTCSFVCICAICVFVLFYLPVIPRWSYFLEFEDTTSWVTLCFRWGFYLHFHVHVLLCALVWSSCTCLCYGVFYLPDDQFFKVWDHDFMSDTTFLLRVLILHASSCVCASVEIFCVCVYVTLARWSVFFKFEITISRVRPYFCWGF